jgi:hypothetical protein
MSNFNHNRPMLTPSQIIQKRCRKVGSEDFKTAALKLRWAENEKYYGNDLLVAGALAQGLELAIELAEKNEHEHAAKQAGNCLYSLKKNRDLTQKQNRKALGSMVIECRDGMTRKLGDIVEWYVSTHFRIAEQIKEAEAKEVAEAEAGRMAAEAEELETLQFALSVADGKAQIPVTKAA